MGICFSCTSRKTEGTVRNVVTGVDSSLPDEDIQICVNHRRATAPSSSDPPTAPHAHRNRPSLHPSDAGGP